MKKQRLDEVLIREGCVENKQAAFILVTEGRVFVDGQRSVSPAQFISSKAKIDIKNLTEYVGRGAYKLEAAIKEFSLDLRGKVCADIGSATGGFTQVMLKNGASRVYAIDTARGKLSFKLRRDERVIVYEGQDVRDVEILPERIDCVTIDVSLIRLAEILSSVKRFLGVNGLVVALFKPQYETRDRRLLRHGVIKHTGAAENLLNSFLSWAEESGWRVVSWIESPIRGSEGNKEFLVHLVINIQ